MFGYFYRSNMILGKYNVMISKDRTNVQLHEKFTKCDDLYL